MSECQCIYCKRSFNPAETPAEHIVLNALGGKRKSHEIVCEDCNTYFSHSVDKQLPESLALIRAILGIPRGKIPTVRARGTRTGKLYRISGSRKKEILDVVAPKTDELLMSDSQSPVQIIADPRKAKSIVDGLQKKHPELAIVQIKGIRYSEPLEPIGPTPIGGPIERRCIAKMGLNFLAICPGIPTDLVGRSIFDSIRRYVRYGEENSTFPVGIDTRNLLGLSTIPNGVFCNRITVSCNPTTSNVVAWVEILSSLPFSVLLSDQYEGPYISAAIHNYPHKPGPDKIYLMECLPAIETVDLLNRSDDEGWLQDVRQTFSRLLKRVAMYDERSYVQEISQEAHKKLTSGGLSTENIEEISSFIAEKIAEGFLLGNREVEREYSDWSEAMEASGYGESPE